MTATRLATTVQAHPLVPAPLATKVVPLRGGGEIRLSLTPLASCAPCAAVERQMACSCCGGGPVHRLVLDHDRKVTTCVRCLANLTYLGTCVHGWTAGQGARHWVN